MAFLMRDWTDSDRINRLDVHAERFFGRLLMKCDVTGRIEADVRLLNSMLFPLRRDIRDADITRWLAACKQAGLFRYRCDSRGRSIIEVHNFGQKLKFVKSRYTIPEDQPMLEFPPARFEVEAEVEVEGKKKARGKERAALNGHSPEVKPVQGQALVVSPNVQAILNEKALSRVEAELKALAESVDSHAELSPKQKERRTMLREERKRLMSLLGLKV